MSLEYMAGFIEGLGYGNKLSKIFNKLLNGKGLTLKEYYLWHGGFVSKKVFNEQLSKGIYMDNYTVDHYEKIK